MTDKPIFIQVHGDNQIPEAGDLPLAVRAHRDGIQAFVDKHDLVIGQEYAIKIWVYPDYINLCLMESKTGTNLFLVSTGDTP